MEEPNVDLRGTARKGTVFATTAVGNTSQRRREHKPKAAERQAKGDGKTSQRWCLTEKYADVPDGVVPCIPAPRYVPLVSTWPRAVVALERLPASGFAYAAPPQVWFR